MPAQSTEGQLLKAGELADGKRLVDALRATRPEYRREAAWHKFLLDAYAGCGGFSGGLQLPESTYWGQAADMYADADLVPRDSVTFGDLDTYLDQFPREDLPKFQRRVAVAHYPNYVSRVVDIKLSYLHRKDATEQNVPDALAAWRDDIDGEGLTWDQLKEQVIDPRAAVLGWCPVYFDMPRTPTGPDGKPMTNMSRAQADQAGIRPKAMPLFPAHVLAWQWGDAGFEWAKLCLPHTDQVDPLREPRQQWEYIIWWRDRWERYLVEDTEQGPAVVDRGEGPNPFGVVPLVIARHTPVPDDPVKGIPMAAPESQEAKRLFNVLSEMDEHMRNTVFAFLQVPTDNSESAGTLTLGTSNALPLKTDSRVEYKWVSPDPSVAETLEKRADTIIKEIYRLARQEYTRGESSGGARSGVTRAFEFETTNRSIADFAKQLSVFDERVVRLLSGGLGYSEEAAKEYKCTPPQRFDVEEMARVIEDSLNAISAGLGVTATLEVKKRLVQQILPNLDDDTRAAIESELEELTKNEEQVRAAEREGRMAAATQPPGDDDEEEEEEEDE